MGCIQAAEDQVMGRRVALKSLRHELRDEADAVAQFIKEARITGQLEHPNVVPIYDLSDNPDDPVIVMRLVQGKSLKALLDQAGERASGAESAALLQQFVTIVMRICDALSFAHSRGVVHCDVKPDNIMVGDHGQVYLMDWGVALTESTRETLAGTAAYMAPEQILGRAGEIDARSDVFGVGGVLYEIMTGSPPNDSQRLLSAGYNRQLPPPQPRALWTLLPPELVRITLKALAPQREERYPSVVALRLELAQFLKGGGWFETISVQAGTIIVREGETGDTAYVIQSGVCEVWKTLQGVPKRLRQLAPGDVFGEAAVFGGGMRTATVTAVDQVTLKVITGASLNHELDQNPMLAAFVRSLANLFREADATLSQS
jgi:eukaryotic-like serine/threonine-protein kinase